MYVFESDRDIATVTLEKRKRDDEEGAGIDQHVASDVESAAKKVKVFVSNILV